MTDGITSEAARPCPPRRESPSGRHRDVGGGPLDGRQRARGPRLVRRRQPAAADAAAAPRPRASTPVTGCPAVAVVVDVRGGQLFTELQTPRVAARARPQLRLLFLDATTPRSCAASRPCGGRIRCRATARSSTASGSSGRWLARCASSATSSSTRPSSTSTSSRPRSTTCSPTTSGRRVRVTVTSFGFKYGLPTDADIVADCASCRTRSGCRSCGP